MSNTSKTRAVLALSLLVSTVALPSLRAASVAMPAAVKPRLGDFGVDLTAMDRTVAPGEDFYKYVNGAWDARTVIPADRANWGGFAMLREEADARARTVAEAAAANPNAVGEERQIADYYASFMDEAAIERLGTRPLGPDLARIAAITTPDALAAAFARNSREGIETPLRIAATIDAKDPDAYVLAVAQGGLGLPDRDYYLDTKNPKYAEARAAYQAHVGTMLMLAGVRDGATQAAAILALETRIAQVHWTRVESRQAEKRYNPVATADLAARFPGFAWTPFLQGAGAPPQPRLIVAQPSAVQAIAALTQAVPLATWRAYLAYHQISGRADVLPKAFVDEDFAFQKVLSGTPELKARWKRGVDQLNAGLGEAVGKRYVARYFPPDAKAKADALVRNLLVAMRGRLEHVTWMAPETRAKALAKLASFRPKIGYPDTWRDYSGLKVMRGDAYGNRMRARMFDYDRVIAKIGRPADRGEWSMTPQTVNAYANPVWNEVVFPAAILQPPFFDPAADPAVNYGAIGAVIGHEISHHFDDQGRKYDATGRLADWWTPQDIERFKTYTDRMVTQYGAYQPIAGVHVNGALTLGENMADLAGLTVAFDAYHISLNGAPPPPIDGFTGDQRFFLGYGQIYQEKARDASVLRQLATDPHTPGNWRPYVVRNFDGWYAAFDVRPGARFYLPPEQRIRVW